MLIWIWRQVYPIFIDTYQLHDEILILQFEIRICPALQHKPTLPAPPVDAGNAGIAGQGKVFDPFAPPYNTNLYVGELKHDESQDEFVVLVRVP